MSAHLSEWSLSYLSVPKCGSTTLASFFFQIENGRQFEEFKINGEKKQLQGLGYLTAPFERHRATAEKMKYRVAVVRDPVKRVVSAYRNRVLHIGLLRAAKFTEEDRERGLSAKPSLENFVDNLQRYQELHSRVKHHTVPLSYFLGTDPSFYERIYRMRELDQLKEFVEELTGRTGSLGRLQVGGPKMTEESLDEGRQEKIRQMYAEDYDLFGEYFN